MAARAANDLRGQGSWHLAIRNASLSRYGAGLAWRARKKPSRRHDGWIVCDGRPPPTISALDQQASIEIAPLRHPRAVPRGSGSAHVPRMPLGFGMDGGMYSRSIKTARRLVLALAVASIVLGCTSSGSPTASPLPTSTPLPSLVAPSETPTSTGPKVAPVGTQLEAGTYVSSVFATPLTFTVPTGWKVFEDEPGEFGLALLANDGPCLCVWRDVRASATNCDEAPQPGVGTTAKAIADWLATHPGLKRSTPKPVTIGGLSGYVLDLVIDPAWTKTCAARGPDPRVPTLVGSGISQSVAWDVSPTDSQRLYLLDLGTPGANIAINVDVCCGVTFETQVGAADQVIHTFAFAP